MLTTSSNEGSDDAGMRRGGGQDLAWGVGNLGWELGGWGGMSLWCDHLLFAELGRYLRQGPFILRSVFDRSCLRVRDTIKGRGPTTFF